MLGPRYLELFSTILGPMTVDLHKWSMVNMSSRLGLARAADRERTSVTSSQELTWNNSSVGRLLSLSWMESVISTYNPAVYIIILHLHFCTTYFLSLRSKCLLLRNPILLFCLLYGLNSQRLSRKKPIKLSSFLHQSVCYAVRLYLEQSADMSLSLHSGRHSS